MIRSQLFIKREVGTQSVIVAVGEATRRFHGMITVNATGSFIWDCLERETSLEEIVAALCAKYEVDADTARRDAVAFVEKLKGVGAIETA